MFNPVAAIADKRDGKTLDKQTYKSFISGYINDGEVSEGQMAALMMAGVLNGFSEDEAIALTEVLLNSGDQLDLSDMPGPTVDKHSTGGVGDGTTLVVAPLLAAAGMQVVKLSGRGLGHTGGTLDKLEAIPGFQTALALEDIKRIANEVGCVVAAQTGDLVPADKALYALRDVTATVPSQALIASSVMSKKLASGADTIVLDVKVGEGAFMKSLEDAEGLAKLCVRIGVAAGRNTRALITDMNTPLGGGIGNALEIREVVAELSSPPKTRFAEVCLALAANTLAAATGDDIEACEKTVTSLWDDGSALETLARMITAQGGDGTLVANPDAVLPTAPVQLPVTAPMSGTVTRIPALPVGLLASDLGAGRQHKDDDVDPAVGIELLVTEGDTIEPGQELAIVHATDDDAAVDAATKLGEIITIGDSGTRAKTVVKTVLA